jgi:hypothetical protein
MNRSWDTYIARAFDAGDLGGSGSRGIEDVGDELEGALEGRLRVHGLADGMWI